MHDPTRSFAGSTLFSLLSLVTLAGCPLGPKQIGDLGDATGSESEGAGDGDGDEHTTLADTGNGDGDGDDCVGPFYPPTVDADCDGLGIPCDNAREHYNPDQLDQDQDGFADVNDLCPLTADDGNTGDSDRDGVGNSCDTCRQTIDHYNLDMAMVSDARMWVRNVPSQADFDQDGIGDVCDNCVTVANCGGFDPQTPHTLGDPVPYEDPVACQTDANADMIGEACIDSGTMMPLEDPESAGPVGLHATDDFDQDGIVNSEDWCPRQPVAQDYGERLQCTADVDCNPTSVCASTPANDGKRYCNHADVDGDQVGDTCDTCAFKPNPMQVADGGMQLDDEDGDFVGGECETNSACSIRRDSRPLSFMEVSVSGICCTTTYPGDGVYVPNGGGGWDCEGMCDTYGFPITRDCADEAVLGQDVPDGSKCRRLPPSVAALPGMLELPPGCADALDDAMLCAPSPANNYSCGDLPSDQVNGPLTLADVGDVDDLLWTKLCTLPQWDQDFDGLGDACDLCPFVFDPTNEPYVDDLGTLWENDGAACSGPELGEAACTFR